MATYRVYKTLGQQSQMIFAPNGFRLECINGEIAIADPSVIRWFESELSKGSFNFQFIGERETFKADPLAALRAQLEAEIRAKLLAEMGDLGKSTPDAFTATSSNDLAATSGGIETISPEALKARLAALSEAVKSTQPE